MLEAKGSLVLCNKLLCVFLGRVLALGQGLIQWEVLGVAAALMHLSGSQEEALLSRTKVIPAPPCPQSILLTLLAYSFTADTLERLSIVQPLEKSLKREKKWVGLFCPLCRTGGYRHELVMGPTSCLIPLLVAYLNFLLLCRKFTFRFPRHLFSVRTQTMLLCSRQANPVHWKESFILYCIFHIAFLFSSEYLFADPFLR